MSQNSHPAKFIKKIPPKYSKSYQNKIPISQPQNQKIQKYYHKYIQIPNNYHQINKDQLTNFIIIGLIHKQIFCIYHPVFQLSAFVDQHAIHQRIRYQYYINILKGVSVQHFIKDNICKSQKTNQVKVIGQHQYQTLHYICKNEGYLGNEQSLIKWGIHMQSNNNNEIFCLSYESIFGKTLDDDKLKQICLEILTLHKMNDNKIPQTLDNIIAQYSCKNAIKFGDEISQQTCKELLHNASLCTFPWRCVHGRQSVHFTWNTCTTYQRQYTLQ